jgi:hypothetical protein
MLPLAVLFLCSPWVPWESESFYWNKILYWRRKMGARTMYGQTQDWVLKTVFMEVPKIVFIKGLCESSNASTKADQKLENLLSSPSCFCWIVRKGRKKESWQSLLKCFLIQSYQKLLLNYQRPSLLHLGHWGFFLFYFSVWDESYVDVCGVLVPGFSVLE